MAELNTHTIDALIHRFNLPSTENVRLALADSYRTGYSSGVAAQYQSHRELDGDHYYGVGGYGVPPFS